jgi:hypothetical protein
MGQTKDNSLNAYRKFKLKILERDFCVHITNEEKAHAETLTTEAQINQFFTSMLDKYWK